MCFFWIWLQQYVANNSKRRQQKTRKTQKSLFANGCPLFLFTFTQRHNFLGYSGRIKACFYPRQGGYVFTHVRLLVGLWHSTKTTKQISTKLAWRRGLSTEQTPLMFVVVQGIFFLTIFNIPVFRNVVWVSQVMMLEENSRVCLDWLVSMSEYNLSLNYV